jgi:DNA polymerase-3 subunit delta
MRINSVDKIESSSLHPAYLLSSDEPLLRDEALQLIKGKAKIEGYNTLKCFDLNAQFKIEDLYSELQQSDLFSEKKIFILNLQNGKPNTETTKKLTEYFAAPVDKNNIFILLSKKLDAALLKTKWLEALDKIGCILQLFAPDSSKLASWIAQRSTQRGLKISSLAISWIIELTEGNLTASHQVIERLFLEYGTNSALSDEQIKLALFDSSQYTIYDLVDTWLKGDPLRSLKILARLKKEGVEPTLILWALMTECRLLARIQFDVSQHTSLETALASHRVWQKRIPLITAHLKKMFHHTLLLQQYLAPIEHVIKGVAPGNVWVLFERFLVYESSP